MTETIGSKLNALRKRAGLSLAQVATLAGMKGPSSVQAYFNDDYDTPIRIGLLHKFSSSMIGQGDPPITLNEVMELSDISEYVTETPMGSWMAEIPAEYLKGFTGVLTVNHDLKSKRDKVNHPISQPAFTRPVAGINVYPSDITDGWSAEGMAGEAISVETFWVQEEPVAVASPPPAIDAQRSVYMIFVAGNAMSPRYKYGEPVFIDPRRPAADGEDVVIALEDVRPIQTGFHTIAGPALVATLIERSPGYLELEQHKPYRRFRLKVTTKTRIHRILPWKECFGL